MHGLLKRGVFKPALVYGYSRSFAVLAVFIASGLFHEWTWQVIFYCHKTSSLTQPCFDFTAGKTTAFFCWNGVIILLEPIVRGASIFQWLSTSLPRPIITLLVLSSVLPVAHLFTGDWIGGGYYHDVTIGLPMVLKAS